SRVSRQARDHSAYRRQSADRQELRANSGPGRAAQETSGRKSLSVAVQSSPSARCCSFGVFGGDVGSPHRNSEARMKDFWIVWCVFFAYCTATARTRYCSHDKRSFESSIRKITIPSVQDAWVPINAAP